MDQFYYNIDTLNFYNNKILPVNTKKKAFYIGSNSLSTSVTTHSGNTVSLNTYIGWRTVFEE